MAKKDPEAEPKFGMYANIGGDFPVAMLVSEDGRLFRADLDRGTYTPIRPAPPPRPKAERKRR